ncbi:AbrB family transcriptional regulator [Rossellomorea aquimaris]|uniref:AbrB family transcriptional regulator n=1 Tax=Rossellomorea aquimaris TaxID=189382 RepID=UPI001CD5FDF0|nr:AbrB family transcriptional regulator [Rossellomorea aquimaris]MCA1059813.1 AbrB family transcriptional regulator [Rossellomorea aquimaris]
MHPILLAFIAGVLGGGVFTLLHLPLSWLLGSMVSVFLLNKWTKLEFAWPSYLRDLGLIIVGYAIGQSFSQKTMIEIFTQLPSMLTTTVTLIVFSMFLAYITSTMTGIGLTSTITGSIPGGLSQMVTLGEEMKNIDLTVVTILQVIRLLSVIFVVPFLVFSPLLAGDKTDSGTAAHSFEMPDLQWGFVLFFAIAVASGVLAKKIHLPTPTLLGPILVIGGFMIAELPVPQMPGLFIILAQLSLGIYFSFMMNFSSSGAMGKFILWSLFTSLCLLLCCAGLSVLLSRWHGISFLTAFISLAPGGMAEMALVGQAVHADLSIITGYHLFRILFILFIIPATLKGLFKLSFFQKDRHG